MKRYLDRQLEHARTHGGEGLIADLVQVEGQGGRISAREMVSMVFLLLGAGTETTTHLISGAAHELLVQPELRDWLAEDWARVDLAVEEFLRFLAPVQFTKPRYARKDVDLDGVRVKRGDRVMAMLAAANMDPAATKLRSGSISRGAPTATLHWGPASISASGASSHASRRPARCRPCSRAGRNSRWQSTRPRSDGANGPGSGRSQACRSRANRLASCGDR